jgi:cell division protein FtsL
MSSATAIQEKPNATSRPSVVRTPKIVTTTRIAPATLPKSQARARAVARARAKERLVGKAIILMSLTIISFGASSLSGQVMVEKTRQDGYSASKRADFAEQQEKDLQADIEHLLRPATIEQWATENGFVLNDAPLHPAQPSSSIKTTLVALKDQ